MTLRFLIFNLEVYVHSIFRIPTQVLEFYLLSIHSKKYDIKECAMHGVYCVNLKIKDRNSIDASLVTGLLKHEPLSYYSLKLGSTAALHCRTGISMYSTMYSDMYIR